MKTPEEALEDARQARTKRDAAQVLFQKAQEELARGKRALCEAQEIYDNAREAMSLAVDNEDAP